MSKTGIATQLWFAQLANDIIRGLTRESLANAMSELNGGMKVTGEEIDAMMQHATTQEYVSCLLSPRFQPYPTTTLVLVRIACRARVKENDLSCYLNRRYMAIVVGLTSKGTICTDC